MVNNEAALDQAVRGRDTALPPSPALEDCQDEAQKGAKFSFCWG